MEVDRVTSRYNGLTIDLIQLLERQFEILDLCFEGLFGLVQPILFRVHILELVEYVTGQFDTGHTFIGDIRLLVKLFQATFTETSIAYILNLLPYLIP